jgi:hypothetical protein
MQYTEKELSKLISDLETEFTTHLAKAEFSAAQPASLAKAEDEKPAEKKDESKDESAAESKPEAKESKEEKPKDAPAAEAATEAKEGEAAPAAPAAEAPAAPAAADASGYDAEDIAHMDQMYMSMSKAELLAHHDSCVRALDAIGAEHTHAQAPAAAAPAAPAAEAQAPAAEIDKCGDMSMSKSETNVEVKPEDVIKPNAELELAKSEAAAAKAKVEELQKNFAGVQEFLTQLVKKVPQGKAITSLEQVTKSESVGGEEKQLSKSEITEKLMKKAAEPTLSKTDRDAINAFYLNQANFNTISHLLK